MTLRVEALDLGDDAALGELLDFASSVGTPRAPTAQRYRDRIVGSVHATCVRAREGDATVAAAFGTIMPMIAMDQVQVNAFCRPGEQHAFDAVLTAIDAWAAPLGAIAATAHVSDPTPEETAAWDQTTYAQVGSRDRLRRGVTPADAQLPEQLPDGIAVVALASRPDLEPAADALWRAGIADIPSALDFTPGDELTIREELELGARDPFPASLLIAVDPTGAVAGVAYLASAPGDPTRAGHRLTAVAPAWRGRGLARGLKVELIRWAATHGVTVLEASNDEHNVAMRRVNERLGYELDHQIVLYRRAIGGG